MKTIKLKIDGAGSGCSDEAWVTDGDVPGAVIATVIEDISTDITVTAGGVTATLAMWRNPEHWETDWVLATGGATFYEYVAGLVAEA